MTPQEFIDYLIPLTHNGVVLQSLLISQICLESGYGKHIFHNNCLGIKCHKGVNCLDAKTQEYINGSYGSYKLAFAVYPDIASCILDYLSILSRARYAPVREAKDYLEATDQISKCGYATSKNYTTNLRIIIEKYKLNLLDNIVEDKQLTKNFKFSEFWSQKITPPPDYMWADIQKCADQLQIIRDIIGKPIIINSGYRTKAWNAANGGAINSFHLYGKACDTRAVGMSIRDYLHYILRYTNFNGIGINVAKNFIHSDLRKDFTIIHY